MELGTKLGQTLVAPEPLMERGCVTASSDVRFGLLADGMSGFAFERLMAGLGMSALCQ